MTFRCSTFTKPRKALKPFSEKKLAQLDEHEAFVARILEERKFCEAPRLMLDAIDRVDRDDRRAIDKAMRACSGFSRDVHHVLQRSLLGKDDDANVLATCRRCHDFTHERIALAHEVGLLVRSWDVPA